MDHEIDKQEPFSTEGGEMKCKVGDWVWVLCKVIEPCENLMKVTGSGDENWFWAGKGQCRPVEPEPKEPTPKEPTQGQKIAERTMKAIWAANHAVNGTPVVEANTKTANDQLRQSLMDYPFGEPANCPEIPDSSSDPINPSHYKQGGIECIEAIKAATGDGFIGYVWGNVLKYLWRWPKKGGVDDLKKARWYLDRLIKEVGE
jgi:hypothetical protein